MNHEQKHDIVTHIPAFRSGLAFPCLTDDMIRRVRDYGNEISVSMDSTLFTAGEKDVDMFVILRGSIGIYGCDENGQRTTIARLQRRQLSDQLDIFNSHTMLALPSTS